MIAVKELHGFRYYTGAHPEIQAHFRSGKRPTEFGNKIWATSFVLLDYLEERHFDLRGLRVLEIGCGWGLLGTYLAKTHGCQVTCTDVDEYVLPIVEMQAGLNGVSVETRQAGFDELSQTFLKDFDLIVGAEVCYSEEATTGVTQLIGRALDAKVAHIVIADPGRPDFDDCHAYCVERCDAELVRRRGTVNGKTTHILSARST